MMKVNFTDVLNSLNAQKGLCVSIYVQDSTQFESSVDKVKSLFDKEHKQDEFQDITKPLQSLSFRKEMMQSARSVALFLSPHITLWTELPFVAKDLSVAAESFHVKPLLKWHQRQRSFYFLKIEHEDSTLYSGSLTDLFFEKRFSNRHHPLRPHEIDLKHLNKKVSQHLHQKESPLVVFAESPSLAESFALSCTYPHCVSRGYELKATLKDGHRQAILALENHFLEDESRWVMDYWQARQRKHASSSIHEILKRALLGHVEHLFINEQTHIWGEINPIKGTLDYHHNQTNTRDDDVLDDVAQLVLRSQGRVTVLREELMPNHSAAAAIFKNVPFQWESLNSQRQVRVS